VLLGEQSVSKAGGVGSNPTGLAFRPRGPAWSGRHPVTVETGSSNLLGDAQAPRRVFEPWGYFAGPCPERRGARLIRGFRLVRLQPVLLDSLVEQRSARHPDMVEIAGSNPAGTTGRGEGSGARGEAQLASRRRRRPYLSPLAPRPWPLNPHSRSPAATASPSHGEDRRFESCREYCGVDWSGSSTVS
jgi:hypothetical protein